MSDKSTESSSLNKDTENGADLNCPLCGGTVRRQWDRVCFINFITFIIFFVLAFLILVFLFIVMGSLVMAILFLISTLIAIVALITLPIMGAIAVASRLRCRVCGHRFWPASVAPNLSDNARFPMKYAVIGIALLLVIFCIEVMLIVGSPGREVFGVSLMITGLIILAGLVPGVGILTQCILWRTLRSQSDNANKPGPVLLLPIAVIIVGSIALTLYVHSILVSKYNPLTRAPRTLAWANLANLPDSARDVHVYSSSFCFVRDDYLRFEAEPEDIEEFIANSPGLEGITCHTYSKNRMRLATSDFGLVLAQDMKRDNPEIVRILEQSESLIQADPDFAAIYKNLRDDGNEYFYSIHDPPAWYKEEIRGAGRYYNLSENETAWVGELIVDDEKHIVYVHKGN